MKKPIVAIVGRPNVGKSTFFNKVCGKRISIVKDTPGVTRDRIYADAEWCGCAFTLIDTGGIELKSEDVMFKHIRKQAELAMEIADVIVFMTDAKDGLISSDYDVAEILRQSRKPVVLIVNKMDNYKPEELYDFYGLGLGEPFGISCEQAIGLGDALDAIVGHFPKNVAEDEDSCLKIALVGRPNVGKSSLVNKILGSERVIVSDVAGTTRDAVDTPFEINGKKYVIIDTAGMRRKSSIEDNSVEDYSVMRSVWAISRADVVVTVIDATVPLSDQDVRIAGYVVEEGKPGIIVVNKWDAVEKDAYTVNKFENEIKKQFAFMDYYVSLYVSAKNGLRVDKIIPLAEKVHENASRRISTGTLNDVIGDAVSATEPPARSGRRLKIYYATQPDVCPPKFVFFVNDAALVHFSYKRYLENALRRAFDFSGTPIKLAFNNRKEEV
ncbi:MAG: ribosome biogenesis GTPase Der [Firmicutes bacterium]|nr:ribosome biogenesis GTPase Der [Bacillota bacterium]MDY5531974.1 ribosome biogenesis GTPase Der [Pumilibacteraceae bacterium]